MYLKILVILCPLLFIFPSANYATIPIVMNTWRFPVATASVWEIMKHSKISAIDAIVVGCTTCEEQQCENTVGFGGSPDENGETTLDAMIFDGSTIDMGAVGGLRRIKNAINVAKHVLKYTEHSFLVGDLATNFAKQFNFKEESLSTNFSRDIWQDWKAKKCQPNFWKNVSPDPKGQCGPYEPEDANSIKFSNRFSSFNHDTIGMIVIDQDGNIAAGTSTNGANHKISGRVGDSPIPGAGAYADNEFGAAVATGDGDIMMRFLPSFLAVEELRRGSTPAKAAQVAINRIAKKYPQFFGGILVSNNKGEFGAACNGMDFFPYSVANEAIGGVVVRKIACLKI